MLKKGTFIGALLALSACSTPSLESGPSLTVVSASSLPTQPSAQILAPSGEYVLGPLDRIQVGVFGIPDLSTEVQIDSAGRVSLPLIGQLDASGRTTIQFADEIETALHANHVRDPQVTINVTEAVSHYATVTGEVEEPGIYPIRTGMTLLQAIASAKGFTEFSKANSVVILRTVGDQKYAALYSVQAIREGRYPDPAILPRDAVIVDESRARRMFKDVIQGSALITAPIIAFVRP